MFLVIQLVENIGISSSWKPLTNLIIHL